MSSSSHSNPLFARSFHQQLLLTAKIEINNKKKMAYYLNEVSGSFQYKGQPIHYNTFGAGDEVILLISGSLGSPKYDFRSQLEGRHAFDLNKYTMIGIDLPGWGQSRPPERIYGPKVNEFDIECCLKLMDELGHKTFSVIGFSEGAKIALAMCYLHGDRIKWAVSIAIFVRMCKETLAPILYTRNINLWPTEQLDDFLKIYGDKQIVQQLWDRHLDVIRKLIDECKNPHYLVTPEQLGQIRTPFLFVHGDRDFMVGVEHSQYCQQHIPGALLHIIGGGSHNCHQIFAAEFKSSVENFIHNNKNQTVLS